MTPSPLSTNFIDFQTHTHIPERRNNYLIGILRFMSLNVHDGIEPSRRDDLISLAYLYVYLYKGSLPWQFKTDLDQWTIANKIQCVFLLFLTLSLSSCLWPLTPSRQSKQEFPVHRLFSQMPKEFVQFYSTVSSLSFDEEPNYTALREPFENLLNKFKPTERIFDWVCSSFKSLI